MAYEEDFVGLNNSISTSFSSPDYKNSLSGKCFICQKKGHFARECPNKSNRYLKQEVRQCSPTPTRDLNVQSIECRCGAGTCDVQISHSEKNPDRKYYSCPAKYERNCDYFQWCDTIRIDESKRSQFNYPVCDCGAGVCHSFIAKKGCNAGRSFFVCRIKKGQGACSFFKWEDEIICNDNLNENTPIKSCQSSFNTHHVFRIFNSDSTKKPIVVESVQRDVLKICHVENTNHGRYRTKKNGDFVPVEESLNVEIWRHIARAQVSSTDYLDWWGRLVFPPSRCLVAPSPKPFYCCVFPSFDKIFVPLDVCTVDGQVSFAVTQTQLSSKSAKKTLLTHDQNDNFSPDFSGFKSPPNVVKGNMMTGSILEVFAQAAIRVQNDLINLLHSMDPLDHEAMIRESNIAFTALDCLCVDYVRFYDCVKEYIFCVALLAKMERSNRDYIFCKDLVEWCESERARLDDVMRGHADATSDITALNKSLEVLIDEVSKMKEVLRRFENRLLFLKGKTMGIKADIVHYSADMLESKRNLEALFDEAVKGLNKCEQWEVWEIEAASRALEKARHGLRA